MMTQEEAKAKFLPLIQAYGKEYHKKTEVLVRPAHPGEVVHTITSDGKETSNVAKKGDFVVRNLTLAKEKYILTPEKLKSRYQKIDSSENMWSVHGDWWTKYKAIGSVKGIRYNAESLGLPAEMQFMAPWSQPMVLKNGDMIVTTDGSEVYRIAWQEFVETYT